MLIGNPWHGIWTPDGLTLPNDDVMDLPTDPAGDYITEFPVFMSDRSWIYPPVYGDCILIKVPDLDVPTTSEAHAALGMEWRNYAFMSGAKRLLCGVEMGLNRWIYIDPADSIPWLVEILFPVATANPRRLRFTRFGLFSEAGATSVHHDYTFGDNLTLDEYDRWEGVYDVRGHWLCDVNSIGSKATVTMIGGISVIGVFPLQHLTITGTPGDDLAVSVAAFIDEDYEETPTCEYHASGTYVITTGDVYRYFDPVGVRLFVSDEPIRIFTGDEFTVSDVLRVAPGIGASTSGSAEGNLFIKTGAHTFEIPFTVEMTCVWNDTLSQWEATQVIEVDGAGLSATTYLEAFALNDAIQGLGWPDQILLPTLILWRRANNVIEVELNEDPGNFDPPISSGEFYSVAIVTPEGITATGEAVNESDDGRYFSFNPVSSALLESADPTCFL